MSSLYTEYTECRIQKSHLSIGLPFAGTIQAWSSQG